MSPIEIFLYAIALSMDAFAVSISSGIHIKIPTKVQYARLAVAFGFFQYAMSSLGYYFADFIVYFIIFLQDIQNTTLVEPSSFQDYLIQSSHSILQFLASLLLLMLGLKMLKDTFKSEKETAKDPSMGLTLIVLALATSMDAFVVGLSLKFLNLKTSSLEGIQLGILSSTLIIGFVCAGLTLLGLKIGTIFAKAHVIGERAEFFGGITIIGIALYNFFVLL